MTSTGMRFPERDSTDRHTVTPVLVLVLWCLISPWYGNCCLMMVMLLLLRRSMCFCLSDCDWDISPRMIYDCTNPWLHAPPAQHISMYTLGSGSRGRRGRLARFSHLDTMVYSSFLYFLASKRKQYLLLEFILCLLVHQIDYTNRSGSPCLHLILVSKRRIPEWAL